MLEGIYIAKRDNADTLKDDIGVFVLPQNIWGFSRCYFDFSGLLVRSLPFPSGYNLRIGGGAIPLLLV
jgi:hypothetical protein